MTYLNAIRYYYKRVKFAFEYGNYDLAMQYINEAMGEIPNNYMNYCGFSRGFWLLWFKAFSPTYRGNSYGVLYSLFVKVLGD